MIYSSKKYHCQKTCFALVNGIIYQTSQDCGEIDAAKVTEEIFAGNTPDGFIAEQGAPYWDGAEVLAMWSKEGGGRIDLSTGGRLGKRLLEYFDAIQVGFSESEALELSGLLR